MATDSSSGNRTILIAVLPMLFPLVLAIGVFFTLQNDVRHLEDRLAADEALMVRDFTEMETRLRAVELESASRLSNIEARLIVIEGYMAEISMLLQQSRSPALESLQP